jgi:hypothetical protein
MSFDFRRTDIECFASVRITESADQRLTFFYGEWAQLCVRD